MNENITRRSVTAPISIPMPYCETGSCDRGPNHSDEHRCRCGTLTEAPANGCLWHSDSVRLYACEPGDPITMDRTPQWVHDAINDGRIAPIAGDSIDGSDWVYLNVTTSSGIELCQTDEWVRIDHTGALSVIHVRQP